MQQPDQCTPVALNLGCTTIAFILLILPSCSNANDLTKRLEQQTVAQLELRLKEIRNRTEQLAQFSLQAGVGPIGYRSRPHREPDATEWVRVDFETDYPIEEIVIVPILLRDTASGFRAEGFPEQFRVIAGTESDTDGQVIAKISAGDKVLPRIAPLVIPIEKRSASWVRIESDQMNPRMFDGRFVLQFSEVMAFSNNENVALGGTVTTATNDTSGSGAWHADFIVDGFFPYTMNGAGGQPSLACVAQIADDDQPTLTIDLESEHAVSQINLHVVDQGDTVPQTYGGDYGVPRLLKIEAASRSDFSDAQTLVELHHESPYDTGPVISRRFAATNCRYIRLTAIEPFVVPFRSSPKARLGFAEIEILANGQNVAFQRKFEADFQIYEPRSITALTDGNNLVGQIVPLRRWLSELAERHDLEVELPLVNAQLQQQYQREHANLNRLMWIITLLSVGILAAIAIGRITKQRAILETQQRIAADLHDELGANIHAIGLLSDLAQRVSESPGKLASLMQKIRELTERTALATANCTNMLESNGLAGDLAEEMDKTSNRILPDLDHSLTVTNSESLSQLSPRRQLDLFMFYKECLTNILRHSSATKVETTLTAENNIVRLKIVDNGIGIANNSNPNADTIPKSLQRRAGLVGGRLSVEHPTESGTTVTLTMPVKRFRVLS